MAANAISPLWRLVTNRDSCLVYLNNSNVSRRFYCVHSIGGEVTSYASLAGLLGPNILCYGIQVPKAHLTREFAASIPAMAAHYVGILTAFEPQGALMLGGWSAGAVIALEMAQQLHARGREVSVLVALDGSLHNTRATTPLWSPVYYWRLLGNVPRWVADDLVSEGNWRFLLPRLAKRLRAAGRSIRAAFTGGIPVPLVEGAGTAGWSQEQLDFARALYVAVQNYAPQRYYGRVLVYAARTRPLLPLVEIRACWEKVAPQAECRDVRGTHTSILRPPRVTELAVDLRARLQEYAVT